ncbi:MAG: thiol:disulfide interchange protein DsbA/DsbL [Burkholderiales bacterium]
MDRREFVGRMAVVGAATAGATWGPAAVAQAGYVEGQHYQHFSPPLPVSAPAGKVEVIEFFSYACPHCHAFEPALDAWVKKLPADVVFRRIPVPFLFNAENFQRLYFSLEALGQVDGVHAKVFTAVHRDKKLLNRPEEIADFVAQAGVDRAKFLGAFNGFGMGAKLAQAKTQMERYKLDGVPMLGIHGRFATSPSMVGGAMPEGESQTRALALTEQLINRVRKG